MPDFARFCPIFARCLPDFARLSAPYGVLALDGARFFPLGGESERRVEQKTSPRPPFPRHSTLPAIALGHSPRPGIPGNKNHSTPGQLQAKNLGHPTSRLARCDIDLRIVLLGLAGELSSLFGQELSGSVRTRQKPARICQNLSESARIWQIAQQRAAAAH